MTFLHPMLFAAGAACVAIPILIHLLARRRRKPVVWGAMRFLLEAYRRQKRRLRIEQLLLLLARCAVVTLVALAVGRPALEAAGVLSGGGRTVYLLIDTSLASSATSPDGVTTLTRHAAAAEALIDSLAPGDRVGVISLAAPAQAIVLPAAVDASAVRSVVSRLEPSDARADWQGAVELLRQELHRQTREDSRRALVAILCDFAAGSADLNEALLHALDGLEDPSRISVVASAPSPISAGNISVVAIDPLRPVVVTGGDSAGAEQVRVRLSRSGEAVAAASTSVLRVGAASSESGRVEGPWARAEVKWSSGQTDASIVLAVDTTAPARRASSGWALLAEIDADAIAGDNTFRRPVGVRESLKVGVIDRRSFASGSRVLSMSGGEWIALALRPGRAGGAQVEPVDIQPTAIDTSILAGLDVVFVCRPDLIESEGWSRLAAHVESGGVVAVFPPPDASVHTWTDAFTRAFALDWRIAREPVTREQPARLAPEQPEHMLTTLLRAELAELARAVGISKTLPLEAGSSAPTVLALDDGSPWLIAARSGESLGSGLVLLATSALNVAWTDLPVKPLMVALTQEIVRQGVGASVAGWAQAAGARIAAPRRAEELRDLTSSDAGAMLVDASGRTIEPARRAALFRALDGRGAERGLIAVNADTRAGNADTQSDTAVAAWLNAGFSGAESGVRWLAPRDFATVARAQEERAIAGWPLLVGALALALLETVLARLFSHALREEGAPSA